MIWLVCYDIANPKRLKRISSFCEKFGIRLQKSAFQVDTDQEVLEKLIHGIKELMNQKTDSIVIYPICEDCRRLSISDGPNKIIDKNRVVIL